MESFYFSLLSRVILNKRACTGGQWDALMNFLMQWSQSNNEQWRETSLDIFSQLLSHLDTEFGNFFDTLQGILLRGLQDPSCKVRLAALSGTVHFLVYRANSRTQFQPLLPQMFEVRTQNDERSRANSVAEFFSYSVW